MFTLDGANSRQFRPHAEFIEPQWKFFRCDDYQKNWINRIRRREGNTYHLLVLTMEDVGSECRIFGREAPQLFAASMKISQIHEPFYCYDFLFIWISFIINPFLGNINPQSAAVFTFSFDLSLIVVLQISGAGLALVSVTKTQNFIECTAIR